MEASDRNHDLTMLYLKNQDVSKLTPAELAAKYREIRKEITISFKKAKQIQ